MPKKQTKKKYTVHYSFYLSDSIEVEADDENEAIQIVKDKISSSEIGNLNEMTVGDTKVWVD